MESTVCSRVPGDRRGVREDPPDISTPKGEAALKSFGRRIALTSGAAEKAGLEYCKELDQDRQTVLGRRKLIETTFKGWQERVMKPLTDWKAREKDRKDAHELVIEQMNNLTWFGDDLVTVAACENRLATLGRLIGRTWDEYEGRAMKLCGDITRTLEARLATAKQSEVERAELLRLRKEAEDRERADREKRIADEAAEIARKAAEKKADDEAAALSRKRAQEEAEAKRKADEVERKARVAEEERVDKIRREADEAQRSSERKPSGPPARRPPGSSPNAEPKMPKRRPSDIERKRKRQPRMLRRRRSRTKRKPPTRPSSKSGGV